MNLIGVVTGIVIVLAILFLINFYRDPSRKIPKGNVLVSPADGRIMSITKTSKKNIKVKKGLIGKINTLTEDIAPECYVISVFMSPLDVHINRAPVDGTIVSVKHTSGKFYRAYDIEKSMLNEKTETVMKNKKIGNIKIIQIAGFLARRIITSVKKNQTVKKGQRIGKIVLGSQVTLIIPAKKIKVVVKKKQYVYAGSTVLGTIK